VRITGEEVLQIARAVARRYARRCWWADLDDLTGEASRIVLEARDRWDPQVGVPFSAYATRAATVKLRDYLWEQSSPVSGGLHNPRKLLGGLQRAPMLDDEHPHQPDPGHSLDEAAWRLRVRKTIRRIANRTEDGDLAVEVLVRGRKPEDVHAETGASPYRAVHLVRRKVRTDATLYRLWRRGP